MGSNLTAEASEGAAKEEQASKPQLPLLGSHGSGKWQASAPRAAAPPEPGGSFSTVDRGERAGRGAPGAAAQARRGLGAGRGPQGSGRRCLLPFHLPDLPPGPRSRPRGASLGGRAGSRRCQLAASGAARQGSFITLGGCGIRAGPAPAAQATATLAAAVHRRLRQPAARALPGPPRWLAPSSAAPPGHWDQPSARGSRDARPVRATGRREEGTVTWDPGVQRCWLGWARLGAARLPGPPRPPRPLAPRKATVLPRRGQPALSHPARPPGCTRQGRPGDSSLKLSVSWEGRKGDGWMDGWMEPRAAGRFHHVPEDSADRTREADDYCYA